jgi:hypothetical protein
MTVRSARRSQALRLDPRPPSLPRVVRSLARQSLTLAQPDETLPTPVSVRAEGMSCATAAEVIHAFYPAVIRANRGPVTIQGLSCREIDDGDRCSGAGEQFKLG